MADETGIVLPWEKDAMAGLEMPDGLSYPDQILYLCLRMLYHQYYQKVIDRETATKEKKKLLDEYNIYQFREELEKQWVEIIRLTELVFIKQLFLFLCCRLPVNDFLEILAVQHPQ